MKMNMLMMNIGNGKSRNYDHAPTNGTMKEEIAAEKKDTIVARDMLVLERVRTSASNCHR